MKVGHVSEFFIRQIERAVVDDLLRQQRQLVAEVTQDLMSSGEYLLHLNEGKRIEVINQISEKGSVLHFFASPFTVNYTPLECKMCKGSAPKMHISWGSGV